MKDKIFTFEIVYNGNDGYNNIQFCAKTKSEAIILFYTWCRQDNFMAKPFPICFTAVVFNQSDADEYGDEYGTPDEYKE